MKATNNQSGFIIFSPTEGFWSNEDGWSSSPLEATKFNFDTELESHELPITAANDATQVSSEHYSHLTHDEMVAQACDAIISASTKSLSKFVGLMLPGHYTQIDNDNWCANGTNINSAVLRQRFEKILSCASPASLTAIYHDVSQCQCWADGDDGFYHQQVA